MQLQVTRPISPTQVRFHFLPPSPDENLRFLDTSEAAKAHSKEVLDSMEKPFYGDEDQNVSKNPNQVAGGLKAAIKNPNITQEGKDEAQKKLDNL